MLKLILVEDGKVLWEAPLQARAWDRGTLRLEFDEIEQEMERFEAVFHALANEGRMRMMRAFFRDLERPMAFTELMNELGMNPKIVSESTKRLRRSGLIEKNKEGKYR
ncbi:MAG: winged helix-turn-helix transcriptional regulator, partial [Candidatus Bathyarchaeota archaeon]